MALGPVVMPAAGPAGGDRGGDRGLSTLHRLIRRMNADLDLQATLTAVVQGVVDDLGFAVAVVNLVRPDGDLEVVAVAGNDDAVLQLQGQVGPRADWDALLAVAEPIGELRFIDHRNAATRPDDGIPVWVPDIAESDAEDAWHPLDELLAPLTSVTDGLTGVLSVDLPRSGRRPDAEHMTLLEMFAAQAQLAIENARLLAAVEAARRADTTVLLGRLRALIDSAPLAVVELNLDGEVLLWNPAAERLLGWTQDEVLGTVLPSVQGGRVRREGRLVDQLIECAEPGRLDVRHPRKDGREVELQISTAQLRDADGALTGALAILDDVTERQALQRRLQGRAAQQAAVARLGQLALSGEDLPTLFRAAAEDVGQTLDIGYVSVHELSADRQTTVVRAGHGLAPEVLGIAHPALAEVSPAGCALALGSPVIVADLSDDARFSAPFLRSRGVRSSACVLIGDGEDPWGVLAAHAVVPDRFGTDDVLYVQTVANVLAAAVERRRVEDEIRHQALHDGLTGLPNRTLLTDRLTMAIASAHRREEVVGLLLLDLNGFKDVNDSLGHDAGDVLLKLVADRLRGRSRASDTAARLGGDEFAVCLPALAGVEDAVGVARELLETLERPFQLYGMSVPLSASIGIAAYPEGALEPGELLRQADVAMYRAKCDRAGWTIFDRSTDDARAGRLATLTDLRRAIHEGVRGDGLELHYQPLVSLDTGRCDEVEALVRWRHPSRGLIPPGDFVPLAEQTGLIAPLTSWVLRESVRQVAGWRRQGVHLRVAVNISGLVLSGDALAEEITQLLGEYDLPAAVLTVEVTESALMAERAWATLTHLSDRGIESSIDDFGTGYSSLGYLKQLPASTIKVDRGFVTGLGDDPRDSIIVASVVELAHKLGLSVVAEGVETEEVAEALRAMSVDVAQGYLFSRPLPPAELLDWLRASGSGRPRIAAVRRRVG